MTRQLFQKYIEHRCTPAEGLLVEEWLRTCTEQELDELLLHDWRQDYAPMPGQQEQALRLGLQASGLLRSRPAVIKYIYRLTAAVAASVLLLLAGMHWLGAKETTPASVAVHRAAPAIVPANDDWVYIVNKDSAKQHIRLDDGTQVLLSKQAGLKWRRHFDAERRELWLDGRALFTVAADKRRPFTVYSGDIATTALGTVFLVDAKAPRSWISVRLLEGRIVVRLPKQHPGKDSLFLRPGDELRYNTTGRTAFVQPAAGGNTTNNAVASIKDNQDALSFTRVPLPDVFEKLMLQYHVTISYNKAAVAAMNFTGAIHPADSLAVVLKVITQMNGLSIAEKDGVFVVAPAH